MKTLSCVIASAVIAAFSVQAFAQASSSNAVEERTQSSRPHKSLKTHGKRAGVSQAASAAGTSDKGTQN